MKITAESSVKKVMIIDDESDICFILKAYLSKENCIVEFAATLNEGISKLGTLKPDLLFLDVSLPDGSGIKSLKYIKELYPDLYIAMISAYDSSADYQTAYELGCNAYISKPFKQKDILNTLFAIKTK